MVVIEYLDNILRHIIFLISYVMFFVFVINLCITSSIIVLWFYTFMINVFYLLLKIGIDLKNKNHYHKI